MLGFHYLDVSLEIEGKPKSQIDKEVFKDCILYGIENLFGEFGTCIPIDVVNYNQSNNRVILRCPSYFYPKLRSALTLTGEYQNHTCCFCVHQASTKLISFASKSTSFKHAHYKQNVVLS